MTNEIQIFSSKEFGEVRLLKDSKTPISHEDTCKRLGINNPRMALKRLNQDGVSTIDSTKKDKRNVSHTTKEHFISWGNFARLVAASRKEIALPFQYWMFDVVMESVMTNGGYIAGQEGIDNESFEKAVAERAGCVVASAYKERDFWHSVACDLQKCNASLEKKVRQLELGRRY